MISVYLGIVLLGAVLLAGAAMGALAAGAIHGRGGRGWLLSVNSGLSLAMSLTTLTGEPRSGIWPAQTGQRHQAQRPLPR